MERQEAIKFNEKVRKGHSQMNSWINDAMMKQYGKK